MERCTCAENEACNLCESPEEELHRLIEEISDNYDYVHNVAIKSLKEQIKQLKH